MSRSPIDPTARLRLIAALTDVHYHMRVLVGAAEQIPRFPFDRPPFLNSCVMDAISALSHQDSVTLADVNVELDSVRLQVEPLAASVRESLNNMSAARRMKYHDDMQRVLDHRTSLLQAWLRIAPYLLPPSGQGPVEDKEYGE